MVVQPIPEGYHTVTPYLIVAGVPRLVDFLRQAFGAEETYPPTRRPDGSVAHAEIRIGDSRVMMGEPMGDFAPMPAMLYLYVRDVDAVYHQAVAAGAITLMEPADQIYGDRNAGVKDPAGNLWWIGTRKEDVSPAELARRIEAGASAKKG
jgi:uncharacterized glyoxalase superfamily protein PhnB